LSGFSKNLPQTGRRMYVTTLLLFVICYFVMIAPAKGCLRRGEQTCVTTLLLFVICYLLWLCPQRAASVGANRHVLRPYCYLLFVICYDCARRAGQMSALVEGEKCFTVICDSTAIAGRLHCNRPAIPYQSSVSMFHAAWRLILAMQVMLGIGHCLEFTTRIEQTACHPVAEPLAWNWICSLCSRKAVKISSAVQSHPSWLRQYVTYV